MSGLTVAVVGATGQVGRVMRTILEERGFPVETIRFFASARSAGSTLPWKGAEVIVEDVATAHTLGPRRIRQEFEASPSKERLLPHRFPERDLDEWVLPSRLHQGPIGSTSF